MAIAATHPEYDLLAERWELCEDSYEGEVAIKERGFVYLPPTSGQVADGALSKSESRGRQAYNSYKMRALYPDTYSEAVEAAVGIMHRKPPTFKLPKALEHLLIRATADGESLADLLRKVNMQQLITGRLGLLGDIGPDDMATLVVYKGDDVRNWILDSHGRLRAVVLNESEYESDENLNWSYRDQYRVLALIDKNGAIAEKAEGVYSTALIGLKGDMANTDFEMPSRSGTTLQTIPFSFINAGDLSPCPDNPPLEGLANLCLCIYRGEADYRQNLFMQGQDTLVITGKVSSDKDIRVGAGAHIELPVNCDAKYIGVSSQGLAEQRQALDSDRIRAIQKSGQLLTQGKAAESGDALQTRVSAQTATLPQIAKAGAAGLTSVLRDMAVWYNANPDEVEVVPNMDFADIQFQGQDLAQLMAAKNMGAPISEQSIHEYLVRRGVTNMSLEEEQAAIEAEPPAMAEPGNANG